MVIENCVCRRIRIAMQGCPSRSANSEPRARRTSCTGDSSHRRRRRRPRRGADRAPRGGASRRAGRWLATAVWRPRPRFSCSGVAAGARLAAAASRCSLGVAARMGNNHLGVLDPNSVSKRSDVRRRRVKAAGGGHPRRAAPRRCHRAPRLRPGRRTPPQSGTAVDGRRSHARRCCRREGRRVR